MEKYNKIRDDAFEMTYAVLMEKFGDSDLLTAVSIVMDSPYESFGLVKGLRQETVSNLFPLIADGSWRVKEAYYCSNDTLNVVKPVPSFVNVESYKEWRRLKEKYPTGFDCYEGGRKAWNEYGEKYPDFWGDARMFDGHAEFRFGKTWIAPRIVTAHFESKNHEDIKEDELFLVIYEDSCNEFKKPMNTNPGICYVLTPNKESFDERKLEIYKHFKSHIVSAYVRLLMRKHDEEEASRWRNELIHISNKMISCN
jgi:hypothetical protein